MGARFPRYGAWLCCESSGWCEESSRFVCLSLLHPPPLPMSHPFPAPDIPPFPWLPNSFHQVASCHPKRVPWCHCTMGHLLHHTITQFVSKQVGNSPCLICDFRETILVLTCPGRTAAGTEQSLCHTSCTPQGLQPTACWITRLSGCLLVCGNLQNQSPVVCSAKFLRGQGCSHQPARLQAQNIHLWGSL